MCFVVVISLLLFDGVSSTNYSNRIVGGKDTKIENFPYQVMVICKDFFTISICGGALINKKTVLTSAHCVYNCKEEDLSVVAGSTQKDDEHEHKIHSVTIHDDYNDGDVSNDIAVVCLKYALRYSERIQSISITNHLYPEGTEAVVTGWGKINNYQLSKTLKYVNVKLISNAHCKVINPLIDYTQLCTSNDGAGPCKGDSGGPLVTHKKLIGLVSYGDVDCTAKMVRMYTNVFHFRKFIYENLC